MCGLAATQLRAGAAQLFYGTTIYVLRAADLGGLYRSTDGSCRRNGPRGPGTTNALRHSTRRAPRPFRGSGPEQRISELMDLEADGCRRTMRSDGT